MEDAGRSSSSWLPGVRELISSSGSKHLRLPAAALGWVCLRWICLCWICHCRRNSLVRRVFAWLSSSPNSQVFSKWRAAERTSGVTSGQLLVPSCRSAPMSLAEAWAVGSQSLWIEMNSLCLVRIGAIRILFCVVLLIRISLLTSLPTRFK